MIRVSIFLPPQWSTQGISKGILSSWSVSDQEVEAGEELGPSGLAGIQLLGRHEILKGSVISQHLELFFGLQIFQLCSPLLKHSDDSKHFFVMDLIVSLSIRHAFGIEGNRMPVLSVSLSKHSCHHSIRGISLQSSFQFRLVMIEYGGICQSSLQFFKGFLALVILYKRYFSFG